MEPISPSEIRVQDPLSEATRKERRNLLIASSVGLIVLKAGIIPSKISALGVEFSPTNQNTILIFTALITIYFLITFIFYAASDFIAWRIQFYHTIMRMIDKETDELIEGNLLRHSEIEKKLEVWTRSSIPVSLVRAIIEFLFPVIYGGIAIWSLLIR